MTTTTKNLVSKSKRWFENKGLNKLSFNRSSSSSSNRRSITTKSCSSSSSSSITSSSSPTLCSPITCPARDHDTRPKTIRSSSLLGNKEEELRLVFGHFDSNGDGKISALELRSYFGSIGEYMSHEESRAVIKDFDTDGDDLIDFQDFLKMIKRDGSDDHHHGRGGDDHGDLKNAFEMFELEKGCITPKSLQRMFARLGDHSKSFDDCAAMIRVFDTDGNGVLDFNEFHRMMT
ncbi:probable calcium-binding protein CML41 [Humulus lupulus]|uniref:probable calcium-binding protein CML41 n=1 Tax=Humulus lupulus TaxID=3486 RepID=UPI002B4110E1|nr:probable calcium-binding protein CML41 [Humulus lupulus]